MEIFVLLPGMLMMAMIVGLLYVIRTLISMRTISPIRKCLGICTYIFASLTVINASNYLVSFISPSWDGCVSAMSMGCQLPLALKQTHADQTAYLIATIASLSLALIIGWQAFKKQNVLDRLLESKQLA